LWGLALGLLLFAGCGLRAVPIYRDQVALYQAGLPVLERDDFLSELSLYQGAPYREGGNSLSGIDCSGLARAVYGALGIKLHRRAADQYGQGIPVARSQVSTGDLLFFGGGGTPAHVGIAVTKNEMMHSSSSRGVVLEDIEEFTEAMHLIGVRRVANLR
jgi:hypothetical protein